MLATDFLDRVLSTGIVAVMRSPSGELLADVAEALLAGGVEAIEVTFTVPRAPIVLEQVAHRLGNKIVLGAGTVLDPETARIAILMVHNLSFRHHLTSMLSSFVAATASSF